MEWFHSLLFEEGIAHTILLYALIISGGIALGKIRIFGISLGVTFVLFVGLFVGHLGFDANHDIVHFIREFGLILFIFSIGLQVGPGFFSSFKKGSMTDPPALAYSNSISENDAPAVAYSTVYPLTMFLRVISAQILILLFI